MSDTKKLTLKELQEFGLLTGGIIAGLFGLVLPLIKGHSLPIIPWIIAVFIAGLGLVLPKSLEQIYQIWIKIGLALGWINNRIILSIVFFLILTPMAFIMKLIKRDTMTRSFDYQAETYRISSQTHPQSSMEKPY